MINLTPRLDKAIRLAARAHEKQEQHRFGGDIPYIIHPFGVMLIASNVTDDEDILVACLMHDILEDVQPKIYSELKMRDDFGDKVVETVKLISHNPKIKEWKDKCNAYLYVLEKKATPEALIVSASDKIHNLQSTITDYRDVGDKLWQRFSTGSKADQLWWYKANYEVYVRRGVPKILLEQMSKLLDQWPA